MLQTTTEAKTLAKRLRREVLNYTAEELAQLTSTQWLGVLARAAGHPSWNVMEAKLQVGAGSEEKPAENKATACDMQEMTCLRNDEGKFDFGVKNEETCQVLDGMSLKRILGRWSAVRGMAAMSGGHRKGQKFVEDYLDWDTQSRKEKAKGDTLYVCSNGNLTERSLIVLLPTSHSLDEPEKWPVREALVTAYRDWLVRNKDHKEHVSMWMSSAWNALGLKLTAAEEARVVEFFEKSTKK